MKKNISKTQKAKIVKTIKRKAVKPVEKPAKGDSTFVRILLGRLNDSNFELKLNDQLANNVTVNIDADQNIVALTADIIVEDQVKHVKFRFCDIADGTLFSDDELEITDIEGDLYSLSLIQFTYTNLAIIAEANGAV